MNRLIKILGAAPVICMTACSGSLFQSKVTPPTIYVLSPGAAPSDLGSAAAIPADLAVLKPRLRTGLESDRIAVQYPDRRLDYFADARWSGALGDMLQDLAVQEFHAHAHLRTVSGDTSVFASAYWLEIEVTDFQAEYTSAAAPTVHVHLLARIGDSGDRRILGRFEADSRQPAAENRLGAIVDAYARAADTAFAEIAVRAGDNLAKASEAR
jgi:cholesterol transport system auxiliary component